MRAFSQAAAGGNAVDLRRASDNTVQTIKTLASGNLDTASASTFCNGTSCFFSKFYDQTGNGRDMSQATAADQFALVFNCVNTSLPCAQATSTSQLMTESATLPSGTVASIPAVATKNAFGADFYFLTDAAPVIRAGFRSGTNNEFSCFNGSNLDNTNATDSAWHAMLCVINGASSVDYVDTTSASGTTGSANFSGQSLQIGPEVFTNITVEFTETGIILSALTAGNQSSLCHNQRVYWNTTGSC